MFPIYTLFAVFVLGSISYGFKNLIDPDMGLFEKTRRKAFRRVLINWGVIYILAVTIWWFKEPIKWIADEHLVEQFIEQHQPK